MRSASLAGGQVQPLFRSEVAPPLQPAGDIISFVCRDHAALGIIMRCCRWSWISVAASGTIVDNCNENVDYIGNCIDQELYPLQRVLLIMRGITVIMSL